ncbi:MAG: hypothetical protein J6V90_12435 [Treponema sp.]|nr:hypothetical protein [Treponema sp.]
MKKKLFAFCLFSIFLAGLLAAQESGDNSSEKKLIPAIKEGAREFNEQKAEQQNERPVKTAQFVGDFLTDKLPLTLDFGAEPGESGSMIFGSLQYDWNERFASRVRFEYKSTVMTEDRPVGYSKSKSKEYCVTFYPCIWYFGDPSVDSPEALWSFGFGAEYSITNLNNESFSAAGYYFSKTDMNTVFHSIAPILMASVKKPLGKYVSFGAEIAVLPMYFIHYDLEAKTSGNYTVPQKYDNRYNIFSTPAITQSVWLDIFRFVRIKTAFKYTRADLGSREYLSPEGIVLSGHYVQHEIAWRYGVELVLPSSNRTRKKDSHLWAGIYYQHEWLLTEAGKDYASEYKGRVVLCFGK